MAVANAIHALAAASTGDPETARFDWQLARSQLSYMKDLNGWGNVRDPHRLGADQPGAR